MGIARQRSPQSHLIVNDIVGKPTDGPAATGSAERRMCDVSPSFQNVSLICVGSKAAGFR